MSASVWLLHQSMGKTRRRDLFDHVMEEAAQSTTEKRELHKDMGAGLESTTEILTILVSNTSAVLGYRKLFLQCEKKKRRADCNF